MPTYSAVSETVSEIIFCRFVPTDQVNDLSVFLNCHLSTDDHSRVHLIPVEGHEHDYINGNFIDVRQL